MGEYMGSFIPDYIRLTDIISSFNTKKINSKIVILQYNLAGDFIREYESMALASKTTGAGYGNISNAIYKKQKTAGGFIWKTRE